MWRSTPPSAHHPFIHQRRGRKTSRWVEKSTLSAPNCFLYTPRRACFTKVVGKSYFLSEKSSWKSPRKIWKITPDTSRYFRLYFNKKKVLKQQLGCVAIQHAIADSIQHTKALYFARRLYEEPVVLTEKGRERDIVKWWHDFPCTQPYLRRSVLILSFIQLSRLQIM